MFAINTGRYINLARVIVGLAEPCKFFGFFRLKQKKTTVGVFKILKGE